jgi:hypothetical protein
MVASIAHVAALAPRDVVPRLPAGQHPQDLAVADVAVQLAVILDQPVDLRCMGGHSTDIN